MKINSKVKVLRRDPNPMAKLKPSDRMTVAEGVIVRLAFEEEGCGYERLWIRVTAKNDPETWHGKLVSKPMTIHANEGDEVEFCPLSIIDINRPGDDNLAGGVK